MLLFPGSEDSLPVAVRPELVSLLLDPAARVLAFVWGALWGSFSNVLIYRLPRGLSPVKPRSACPECKRAIVWYENVPIFSYLILRGKCRGCGAAIPLRYLVVEALAGVLSFALYYAYVIVPLTAGGGADGLWTWLLLFAFCLGLIVVIYTDLDLWIIPDAVVLPLAVVGLAAAVYDSKLLGVDWPASLLAAVLGYGLIWGIRWIYLKWRKIEAMGLGDAKLLLAVGAFTGPFGLAWTVGAGAIQGLLIGVPLLMMGKKIAATDLEEVHGDDPELGKEDPDKGIIGMRIPFGPFLAMAALEFVMLRDSIESIFGLRWALSF